MTSYQKLQCNGEIAIVSGLSADGTATVGSIKFRNPTNTGTLSQIKCIASTAFTPIVPKTLILDSSGMTQGSAFRTDGTQGNPSYVGSSGKNNPYALTVGGPDGSITCSTWFNNFQPPVLIDEYDDENGNAVGNAFFQGERYSTIDRYYTPTFNSYLATMFQHTYQPDEKCSIGLLTDGYDINFGVWSPSGDVSATDIRGWVGMDYGADDTRMAMTWDTVGNCYSQLDHEVTGTLTADTISATTYIGLPTPPTPDLTPITLDTLNNRVGINDTTPSYSLDITGTFRNTGNAFVGGDLDVTGNAIVHGDVDATGHFVTADHINGGVITGTSLVGPLATAAQPNVTSVGTLGSLAVTGTATANTFSATTLTGTLSTAAQTNVTSLGTLSSLTVTGDITIDSTTLKVDSANNRVGIVKGTPTESLDVTGNIKTTGDMMLANTLVSTGTGTPEGVKTAPVGSIFLRTNGAAGTSMYIKESGSGNTGWVAPLTSAASYTPTIVSSYISSTFTTTTAVKNITSISLVAGTWAITARAQIGAACSLGVQTTSLGSTNTPSSGIIYISCANPYVFYEISTVLVLSSTTTVYFTVGGSNSTLLAPDTGIKAVRLGSN